MQHNLRICLKNQNETLSAKFIDDRSCSDVGRQKSTRDRSSKLTTAASMRISGQVMKKRDRPSGKTNSFIQIKVKIPKRLGRGKILVVRCKSRHVQRYDAFAFRKLKIAPRIYHSKRASTVHTPTSLLDLGVQTSLKNRQLTNTTIIPLQLICSTSIWLLPHYDYNGIFTERSSYYQQKKQVVNVIMVRNVWGYIIWMNERIGHLF